MVYYNTMEMRQDYGCQNSCYNHQKWKQTINQEENTLPTFQKRNVGKGRLAQKGIHLRFITQDSLTKTLKEKTHRKACTITHTHTHIDVYKHAQTYTHVDIYIYSQLIGNKNNRLIISKKTDQKKAIKPRRSDIFYFQAPLNVLITSNTLCEVVSIPITKLIPVIIHFSKTDNSSVFADDSTSQADIQKI